MPNEITVKTWEDCEADLRKIQDANRASITGVFFRGQASANWALDTTLERRINDTMSFVDYYNLIGSIKPAVETFTNSNWSLPSWETIREWSSSYEARRDPSQYVLAYNYLTHLRHNEFPSPLLDWTASPYVAAFFVFFEPQATHVAIYAYSETPKNIKIGGSNLPKIDALGPIVRTHPRHFRQQSRYTICGEFIVESGWQFAQHQRVFELASPDQDVIWKITIPASLDHSPDRDWAT